MFWSSHPLPTRGTKIKISHKIICERFLVIHTYFYLFVVCCALSINNCLRASIYCIWFSSLASEPHSKVDRCKKQFAIIAQKILWLQRKKLRKRQLKRPLRSADSCISATTRRSILSKEKSFVLGGGFFFAFVLISFHVFSI